MMGPDDGPKVRDLGLVCLNFRLAATLLAPQSRWESIKVVDSKSVAQKHPAESNGTPAMDLEHKNAI